MVNEKSEYKQNHKLYRKKFIYAHTTTTITITTTQNTCNFYILFYDCFIALIFSLNYL